MTNRNTIGSSRSSSVKFVVLLVVSHWVFLSEAVCKSTFLEGSHTPCSGNGDCINNTCICYKGWNDRGLLINSAGTDCIQPVMANLIIFSLAAIINILLLIYSLYCINRMRYSFEEWKNVKHYKLDQVTLFFSVTFAIFATIISILFANQITVVDNYGVWVAFTVFMMFHTELTYAIGTILPVAYATLPDDVEKEYRKLVEPDATFFCRQLLVLIQASLSLILVITSNTDLQIILVRAMASIYMSSSTIGAAIIYYNSKNLRKDFHKRSQSKPIIDKSGDPPTSSSCCSCCSCQSDCCDSPKDGEDHPTPRNTCGFAILMGILCLIISTTLPHLFQFFFAGILITVSAWVLPMLLTKILQNDKQRQLKQVQNDKEEMQKVVSGDREGKGEGGGDGDGDGDDEDGNEELDASNKTISSQAQ